MPFVIPDYGNAAYPFQAAPDAVDFTILSQGSALTGALTGCAVTQRGAGANMSVDVAAGTVSILGVTAIVVAGGNVVITAADATNPRIDLIVSDGAGALTATAGVAAAVPLMPAPAASRVVLAAVYVPANAASILDANITDKRVTIPNHIGTYGTLADPLGFGFPCTGDPLAIQVTASAVQANRNYYVRSIGGGPITKVGVVIGATSIGNVAVATYANSGSGRSAVPAARTATSGSVACPTANTYAEVSLTGAVTIAGGDWFDLAVDDAPTVITHNIGTSSGTMAGRSATQGATFPPPDPATPVASTTRNPLMIGVA
jgi:hypothetical protein